MGLSKSDDVVMYVVVFVFCVLGINGKPSLSLNLPAIGPFRNFGSESTLVLKMYSGRRVEKNSIRMVYYYDQTVAVVELGPHKLLLNCELIEVLHPDQVLKVLGDLGQHARPVGISFQEMLTLMEQCKQVEGFSGTSQHEELNKNNTNADDEGRGLKNPFTLLSGIIPGTKWCGTGDIAQNYFDLGSEVYVDACCRAHDLCPVKIRAHSAKYNLTNKSLYTKSHCKCDDELYHCLKRSTSPTANIMGNIYFNIVQIPCIDDTKKGRKFREARNNF